jgi:hypothetical protein
VYISRLVKTRDPYPGLLQFAIQFRVPLPFQSASLRRHLSIPLSLSTLFSHFRLSGGAITPFSLYEDLVPSQPSVRERQSRVASHSK